MLQGENQLVKRVLSVKDSPLSFPKVLKLFFSFPGRISCVWRRDSVKSLCLFGAETGFPPLAFPWRRKSTEQRWNCPLQFRSSEEKNKTKEKRLLIWSRLSGIGSSSSRWHACVQQTQQYVRAPRRFGCGASSSVRRWLPPFSPRNFQTELGSELKTYKAVSPRRPWFYHSRHRHHLRCGWVGNLSPAVVEELELWSYPQWWENTVSGRFFNRTRKLKLRGGWFVLYKSPFLFSENETDHELKAELINVEKLKVKQKHFRNYLNGVAMGATKNPGVAHQK